MWKEILNSSVNVGEQNVISSDYYSDLRTKQRIAVAGATCSIQNRICLCVL
jgi:hypothetical protein